MLPQKYHSLEIKCNNSLSLKSFFQIIISENFKQIETLHHIYFYREIMLFCE